MTMQGGNMWVAEPLSIVRWLSLSGAMATNETFTIRVRIPECLAGVAPGPHPNNTRERGRHQGLPLITAVATGDAPNF